MTMTTSIDICFSKEDHAKYPSLYESGVPDKCFGKSVGKVVDELIGFLEHIQAVPSRSASAVTVVGGHVNGVYVVDVGGIRDCLRNWIMGNVVFDISNMCDHDCANMIYRRQISVQYDFGDLDFTIEKNEDWDCETSGLAIRYLM